MTVMGFYHYPSGVAWGVRLYALPPRQYKLQKDVQDLPKFSYHKRTLGTLSLKKYNFRYHLISHFRVGKKFPPGILNASG